MFNNDFDDFNRIARSFALLNFIYIIGIIAAIAFAAWMVLSNL